MEVVLLIETNNFLSLVEDSFVSPEELELFQIWGAKYLLPPLVL